MQTQYITLANLAPIEGTGPVCHVSHEFPESGYSYEQMRSGECRAYVRVTILHKEDEDDDS